MASCAEALEAKICLAKILVSDKDEIPLQLAEAQPTDILMPRTTFCISLGRTTQVDTSLEPVLPEKQRSAVDMTIQEVQSSTPQRPQDGAARLTLARGYAYMGARKLRDSQIRGGRMSWSAS